MTQQMRDRRWAPRADVASEGDEIERRNLDQAWQKFRNELDARLVERFGPAYRHADDPQPDPAVLADLALQRALMP